MHPHPLSPVKLASQPPVCVTALGHVACRAIRRGWPELRAFQATPRGVVDLRDLKQVGTSHHPRLH